MEECNLHVNTFYPNTSFFCWKLAVLLEEGDIICIREYKYTNVYKSRRAGGIFVPIFPCPLKHSMGGGWHMYWHGHDTQQGMRVCEETEWTGVSEAEGPASPGSLNSPRLTRQQVSERQLIVLLCSGNRSVCVPPTHTQSLNRWQEHTEYSRHQILVVMEGLVTATCAFTYVHTVNQCDI